MTTAQQLSLSEASRARGHVVVMDVLRAFTTAAYAFGAGAERIVMVDDVESAFLLRKHHPDWLLMGEVDGYPVSGFDFSNSPAALLEADLSARTLIQRTSAGTQGVTRVQHARRLFCGSLVCATATAKVLGLDDDVSYVITEGDEDSAGAEFIEARRLDNEVDARTTRERVYRSRAGRRLLTDPAIGDPRDVELACDIDRFNFAITAELTEIGVVASTVPGVEEFVTI